MVLDTTQWFVLLMAVSVTPTPPSPTPPPAPSPPQPPLDIHKYFANASYAQRQYACSPQELRCFKARQLLHAGDGQCYAVGERGPCGAGRVFHADKAEAARRGGHLRGTCASRCADAARAPVAATGECLSQDEVERQICRKEWYLRPAKDAFDEWVCEWTHLVCSPPANIGLVGDFYGGLHYNGICSAPDIFRARTLDGKNVTVLEEKPEDHPLAKYFTNETYLEREYPCCKEEAACLRYGRVAGPKGKCYVPGQWSGACENGTPFHIDAEEALKEGGSLRGSCRSACGDFKQPHIVTGECVDYAAMADTCRWDWGMSTELNAFGQMACACLWIPARGHVAPTLPPAAGAPDHCRPPKFSNPVRAPVYDETLILGVNVPCTEEEYACMQEDRVLAGGACHALRTQGPCAAGEQLVLDKEALARARLQAVCKALPCPAGSVLLPIDGRCLTLKQAEALICPGEEVALDEFGGWQCSYSSDAPANFSRVTRDAQAGACELPEKYPRHQLVTLDGPAPAGVDKPEALASSGSGPTAYGAGGNFV